MANVDTMPLKALAMILSKATTSQDKDTSMANNNGSPNSQVVMIKELKRSLNT